MTAVSTKEHRGIPKAIFLEDVDGYMNEDAKEEKNATTVLQR